MNIIAAIILIVCVIGAISLSQKQSLEKQAQSQTPEKASQPSSIASTVEMTSTAPPEMSSTPEPIEETATPTETPIEESVSDPKYKDGTESGADCKNRSYLVTEDEVNLREGPSTDDKILKVLAKNEALDSEGDYRDNGFIKVRADAYPHGNGWMIGWVHSDFLKNCKE